MVDFVNPCPAHSTPEVSVFADVGLGAQLVACLTHVGGVPPAGRRIFEPDWCRVPNLGQNPMHVLVVLGATRTLNEVDPDEATRDGFQLCQKVWVPAAEGKVCAPFCVSGPCRHRDKAHKSLQNISW